MRVRVREAARAASMRIEQRWVLPLRRRPERRLPADSLLPGASPAQAARCLAVGNRDMSTPISEITTLATRSPIPGMVINSSIWAVNGPISPAAGSPVWPMVSVTWVSIWSRWSMRARCRATICPWWAVNRPARASRRSSVLFRSTPAGQSGQDHRVAFAGDQRGQHGPAGDAEGVRGDVVQLDPGGFEDLQQPLLLPAAFLGQLGLVPGEVPHRPDLFRGQEAAPQQPDLHQLGQPLGVLDVGFAARDRLDMRGFDHLDDQVWSADLAERGVHRPPVRPGGLHRHMRDTPLHHQPGRHLQQLTVERAERAGGLPPHPTLFLRRPRRDRDLLLVHIDPTHTGVQDLQRASVPRAHQPRRYRSQSPSQTHDTETRARGQQPGVPGTGSSIILGFRRQRTKPNRRQRATPPKSFTHHGWSRQGPWGSWVVHVPHDGWAGCRGAVLYSSRLSRGSAAIRGRSWWLWTAGSHPTMSRAGRLRAAG